MDSSKIKAVIVSIIALFAALYLGITAATAQLETVAWVVGTLVLVACLFLGRRIWLLIPFLGSLQLTLMIPGRPSTMLVAQILVICFTILMLLTRKLPFSLRMSELEFWILLMVLLIVQVYIRNPIGVSLFGDQTVGGRPYILFAIAVIASLILCGLRTPPQELRTAVHLSIIGGIINFFVGLAGWFVPAVGSWFGVASSSTTSGEFNNTAVDTGATHQLGFIVHIPIMLARWVSSYVNPVKASFTLRWAPLILLSFAFAAISGYRNVIGAVGLTYLVGIFYRGRMISVVAACLFAALLIALLAGFNAAFPLPPNMQRSLSFLPGTWEQRFIRETEHSNDWRFEMWEEVLTSDRWIQNKIIGDGLGFSAREMQYQLQMNAAGRGTATGTSGFDMNREYVMVNGDYHSGPVSAVRTIGYIGLLIMAAAQIRLVVHAHRQIMRCRNTEWYPVALFFGIPIVWAPVFFWFIFGAFQADSVALLINAGMLRMLENNLPLPAYIPPNKLPYVLKSRNNRLPDNSIRI